MRTEHPGTYPVQTAVEKVESDVNALERICTDDFLHKSTHIVIHNHKED